MNPQTKYLFNEERTEEFPAQELGTAPGEALAVLSAEQIYAQRLAESPLNGEVLGPSYIP